MGSSSSDSDDSDATVASSASVTSSVLSTVSEVDSKRPKRDRKRKRNDDSVFEELEIKCRKQAQSKASKKVKKSAPKTGRSKGAGKQEPGVKPNANSKLERQVAIAGIERLKNLQKAPTPVKPALIKLKSPPKTVKPPMAENSQGGPSHVGISVPGLDNQDLTPRKIKMLQEIAQLRSQVASQQPELPEDSITPENVQSELDNTIVQGGNSCDDIYMKSTVTGDMTGFHYLTTIF